MLFVQIVLHDAFQLFENESESLFIYGFLKRPFNQLYVTCTHLRAHEFLFLFDHFAC